MSLAAKFHLKLAVLSFGPNLLKMSIFNPKMKKKLASPSHLAYSKCYKCLISS